MKSAVVCLTALAACGAPPDQLGPDAAPVAFPERLSQAGLYADIATKEVAAGSREFAPQYVLWSDGADKRRWVQLPAGAEIDTTDPDHWRFPVGTKFFKEFGRDGARLETRLIWRVGDTGDREADTLMGAFVWDDDESDAVFAPDGASDLRGTDHDAPSADACWRCHIGEPGQVLGLSGVQLADPGDWPLSTAVAPYQAPEPALGYLHANCGHCHSPSGGAWPDSGMVLRLDVAEQDAAGTQIVQTTVDQPLEQWLGRGFDYRIVAGDPAQSALAYRMGQRGSPAQMPPLASEHADADGQALVNQWIESLSP